MRNRGRGRMGGRLVAAVGGDPGHTILTITYPINPIMTTAGPHGLVGGEFIIISGNSLYNGLFGAVEAPDSPTVIVINTLGDGPLPTGIGGTWRLA